MKNNVYASRNTYAERERQRTVPLPLLKLLTFLLLLLVFNQAQAQVTCPLNSDFSLTGTATITSGYIRLTTNALTDAGQAWSKEKTVALTQDFNATFKTYFGSAASGSGIAFLLRGNTTQTSSSTAAGLGYRGITPSLAFEFDTYYGNATSDPSTGEDHFALHRGGDDLLAGRIGNPVVLGTAGEIEDSQWHDVIVDWKAASKTLTVSFDGSVKYTVVRDIVALDFAGDPLVSFGFTARGGALGSGNEQRVCVSSINYTTCIAPTLSNTSAEGTCPTNTVNLNNLVTSLTPSGASLVWFTNNAHTGTAYSTPNAAVAGTYYAFYYNAGLGCYSPPTAAVTVTKSCCGNSEFNLTGNATISGKSILLTPDLRTQAGQAWSKKTVDLKEDFNQEMEMYLGTKNLSGGDGFAFVFRGNTSQTVGATGVGLGYGTITPSLAFEFDTFSNVDNTTGGNAGDLTTDHFALHRNGDYYATGRIGSNVSIGTNGNIEDGLWHTAIIDWKAATKTLTVSFDGTVIYTVVRDIVALDFAGNSLVTFGFTASTGSGGYNEQRVCVQNLVYTPCNAGTTAPALSGTTTTTVCPTKTANLNGLVTSPVPNGASLVWFTNNAHTGTAYGTPTAAVAGTYYAFYYDAAGSGGGCYSPASAAVTVNLQTTLCADLSLTASPNISTKNKGEIITYTYTLSNAGPDAAPNAKVRIGVPNNTTLLTAQPSQGTYVESSSVWEAGNVASGAAPTLTVTVKMN